MLRALIVLLVISSPAAADSVLYKNSRYGTSAKIPTGLYAVETKHSDDGQIFKKSGLSGVMTVYGAENQWGAGTEGYRRGLIAQFKKKGLSARYETGKLNSFMLAGTMNGNEVFLRVKGCKNGPMHHIFFSYPAREKTTWQPIIQTYAPSVSGPCR